jgi:hypothetical protein
MFKKILVDIKAVIDLPVSQFARTQEAKAEEMEDTAKELTIFLRDHRSKDSYGIKIEHTYKSICEFCGLKEERDSEDIPLCCDKAIREFCIQKGARFFVGDKVIIKQQGFADDTGTIILYHPNGDRPYRVKTSFGNEYYYNEKDLIKAEDSLTKVPKVLKG